MASDCRRGSHDGRRARRGSDLGTFFHKQNKYEDLKIENEILKNENQKI